MPAENKIGAGTPDWLFLGCRDYHPRSSQGGGDRRAVYGASSPARPSRALITIAPAPARGPWGRASMVLFDGEGVPSPASPRVIAPRSGAWGDAGEEYNWGCFPGPAFPGLSPALPPPTGAGEEREARAGWGREESGAWVDACGKGCFGSLPRACAPPGISPALPRSCAGALGKGQYGFCRRGGGSLPDPSPGDIPTVRCMG